MKPVLKFLASLELTLGVLVLSMVLILFGTIDQVHLGIHGATEKYFYTVFVFQYIETLGISVPYMPGGYFLGFALLINLLAAMVTRFRFSVKKVGIWMVHVGLILLLLGEFVSSVFQHEASLTLDEGSSRDFTESFREAELAIIDRTFEDKDRVYAIPDEMLQRGQQVNIEELPFYITVDEYMANSQLMRRDSLGSRNTTNASEGIGLTHTAIEIPKTGKMNERNIPSVVVTIFAKESQSQNPEVLGTWLAREFMPPQSFTYQDRNYTLEVRRLREVIPYTITLNDFSHDRYLGTNIPKNFSSQVTVSDKRTGTSQDFLIYMNNPLRYDDLTFYQQGFMNEDRTSILQVVRNPAAIMPYISCTIITLGMLVQFTISLTRFTDRRQKKASA